jgi:hypothetical protein
MKIIRLFGLPMALVLFVAACTPNYAELVVEGDIRFADVPAEDFTNQLIEEVLQTEPWFFLHLPKEKQSGRWLNYAVDHICPGPDLSECPDDRLDRLDAFLDHMNRDNPNVLRDLGSYNDIVHYYPEMLVHFPDEMWTPEQFRRTVRETPYWGILASQVARCNLVHAVSIDLWHNAALGYPDYFRQEVPQHVQQEVLGNSELLLSLVEQKGFVTWRNLITPEMINPTTCRANYRYLEAHIHILQPSLMDTHPLLLPGACLPLIGEFPEVMDRVLVGS